MKKFSIALVIGEHSFAESLSKVLDDLGYDCLPPARSYSEAMEIILREHPDFLILSKELTGQKQGKDLALWMNQRHPVPYFYIDYNVSADGLEVSQKNNESVPLSYPFIKQQLQSAIISAVQLFHSSRENSTGTKHVVKQNGNFCYVKEGNTFYRLEYRQILYVESRENYLKIVSESKSTLVVRATMKEFQEILASENFLRISRSHIIHLDHIEKINTTHVSVNGISLAIGKTYKDMVYKTLGLRDSGISVSHHQE